MDLIRKGAAALTIFSLLIMLHGIYYSQASDGMVIKVPSVYFKDTDDRVIVQYSSPGKVFLSHSEVDNVGLRLSESYDDGSIGVIEIRVKNLTSSSIRYSLILYAHQPIELNLSLVSGGISESLGVYHAPANISVQLDFQILKMNKVESLDVYILGLVTPKMPIWEYLVYLTILPLFLVTGILDLKDFKRRYRRWGRLDTFALILRYAYYASFFVLLFVGLGSLISLIYGHALRIKAVIALSDLLLAFILFSSFAIVYGIGRWRGWYDLIDEE